MSDSKGAAIREVVERKLSEVVAWTLADSVRMALGGQKDIEAIDSLVTAKTDQILAILAQEVNKARLIKPGEVIPYINHKGRQYIELRWLTDRIKDLESGEPE